MEGLWTESDGLETLLRALITLPQELEIVAIDATLIYALSKRVIDQYFEKSLQAHQNELERDRIRFSDLDERRAEIVSNSIIGSKTFVRLRKQSKTLQKRPLRMKSLTLPKLATVFGLNVKNT
jgi:hypothetical protein